MRVFKWIFFLLMVHVLKRLIKFLVTYQLCGAVIGAGILKGLTPEGLESTIGATVLAKGSRLVGNGSVEYSVNPGQVRQIIGKKKSITVCLSSVCRFPVLFFFLCVCLYVS